MTALRDPFDVTHKKPLKNKQGQTIAELDYVSWSQSADRLDDTDETAGLWSFAIVNIGEDWVHGRLSIGGRHFENIGYAENADQEWKKEALKDAASDAFKRCAALAGVGRYLYDKDAPRNAAPARQERPTAPASVPNRPRPHVVDTDLMVDDDEDNPFDTAAPQGSRDAKRCPHHPDREPRTNRRGLYCSAKGGPDTNENGFCNWTAAA